MIQWQLQSDEHNLSALQQKASSSDSQGTKARHQNLIEFLRASPLYGLDLEIERDRSGPRDIDL